MDNKKIGVVKKKGVPLGKPLQLTEADLDRLSVITPMDIEEAKIAWRNMPNEYKNLLDAEVKPTDANQ